MLWVNIISVSGSSENCCCFYINAVLIMLLHILHPPMSAYVWMNMSTLHSTDVPRPADDDVSVVALNEAGKFRVTWSRPTLGPGQVITGYSVQYRRIGHPFYTTLSTLSSSTTSYTITDFTLGAEYEVRVASVGPLGRSAYCCGSGKHVTTYNSECTV